MKKNKSNKPHPKEETIDPELNKNLDDLVKKGLLEKFVMNGQVIYGITPLGDRYVEEVILKKNKNKLRKLP